MNKDKNKPLNKLDFLIGKWQSSGITTNSDSTPVIQVSGTDSYEWVLSDQFLKHSVDVMMGDKKVQVIEMIGSYSDTDKTFEMNSYDNEGNLMNMKGSLTCEGTLLIEGKQQRATLTASDDGKSMEARWEQLNGNDWVHWMDMKFSRIE